MPTSNNPVVADMATDGGEDPMDAVAVALLEQARYRLLLPKLMDQAFEQGHDALARRVLRAWAHNERPVADLVYELREKVGNNS
ncbi:MAG: hypothetical protein M0031_09555 [Thermaerobacter sp.]|nr:hypothetical protein [Thermaerobacter sp.]